MVVGVVVAPSLVGRSQELHRLARLRVTASRERGAMVLVTGESGIGKSRLLRAFRETLRGGRARFGLGCCAQTGCTPYGPLAAALAAAGCAPPAEASSQPELIAGYVAALAGGGRRGPIVLVIEDVHWADQGTLSALVQILAALPAIRAFVVLTYRDDELPEDSAAAAAIARLERGAERIKLEPLDDALMRALLRAALGERAVGAAVLDEIVERAEGNPFFAEELLKNVLENGPAGGRQLPLTIRATVLERLTQLDPGVQRVAAHAAILGRTFSAGPLGALCGLSDESTLAALRSLCERQITVEHEFAENNFAFRHALTQEVIYRRMLASEAGAIHRHALTLLAKLPECSSHDLGYHALLGRDAEACVKYNERAGDEADALYAYVDAVRCYRRAVALGGPEKARMRILSKAAQSASKSGKASDSAQLYERAVESAKECGDSLQAAELRGAMAIQVRLSGESARSEALLMQALADCGDEGELKNRLSLHLAYCKCDRSDIQGAQSLVDACESARGTELYWSVRRYLACLQGDVAAVRASAARSIELAAAESPLAELRAQFNFGFSLCASGCNDEAAALLEMLLPKLRQLRIASLEVLACANLALTESRKGDPARARVLVERGLSVPEPQTTGRVALAAAALTIAPALDDADLVSRALSADLVEAALRCGIDSTLGRFAGPYARWLHHCGEGAAAATFLAQALAALGGPFGGTETLVAAAELLAAPNQDLLRLMAQVEALRELPIYARTLASVQAAIAASPGRPVGRKRALNRQNVFGASAVAVNLSARETQIARLVASGASNRALAEHFALSQRTIEKHLTAIYAKLGLRTRAQLAVFMSQSHSEP